MLTNINSRKKLMRNIRYKKNWTLNLNYYVKNGSTPVKVVLFTQLILHNIKFSERIMEIIKNDFRPINLFYGVQVFYHSPRRYTRHLGKRGAYQNELNQEKKKFLFDWFCSSSMTIFAKIMLTSDVFIFIFFVLAN
jgi:hypothetical protein